VETIIIQVKTLADERSIICRTWVKGEAPSTNIQAPEKLQASSPNPCQHPAGCGNGTGFSRFKHTSPETKLGYLCLDIIWSLDVGA
jgi:hypothetical protein